MDSTQTVRTPECTWPLKGPSRVRMEAWRSGCFTNPKLHARRFLWTRGGLLMETTDGRGRQRRDRGHLRGRSRAPDESPVRPQHRPQVVIDQLVEAEAVVGDRRGRVANQRAAAAEEQAQRIEDVL